MLYYMMIALLYSPVGIYYYFYFRRVAMLFMGKNIPKILRIFLFLLAIFIVLLCANPFGVWIVFFSHLFFFSLLIDFVMFLLKKITGRIKIIDIVYRSGFVPLLFTVLVFIFAYFNMTDVESKYYEIYTDKDLNESYEVVFLSDLHFGTTMNEEKLESYAEKISLLSPDIVILGGDIVDENTSRQQMVHAFNILGKIKSKYGIFFVYGNHDKSKYYNTNKYTEEELASVIESSGITILADESYVINEELVLIGRDDVSFPKNSARKSSYQLKEGLDTNQFWLIIDHHPYDLDHNAQLGYDLQLSGHTHDGQIFPIGLLMDVLDSESLNYGYRKIAKFQAIVTSGMGGWSYPLRTGSHSEYLMITIRSLSNNLNK